jgi:hypothetical protein
VVEFAPSSIPDRKLVAEVISAAIRMAKKVSENLSFSQRQNHISIYILLIPRLSLASLPFSTWLTSLNLPLFKTLTATRSITTP